VLVRMVPLAPRRRCDADRPAAVLFYAASDVALAILKLTRLKACRRLDAKPSWRTPAARTNHF